MLPLLLNVIICLKLENGIWAVPFALLLALLLLLLLLLLLFKAAFDAACCCNQSRQNACKS
jgi:hypothetical protein